jgi:hypothetical protein
MGGLTGIKILHPLRMVFPANRTKNQVIENFQVVEKGHCGMNPPVARNKKTRHLLWKRLVK